MAKTLPPKLDTAAPTQPHKPAVTPAKQTSPQVPVAEAGAPATQKDHKQVDWSQKGYFDGDGVAEEEPAPTEASPGRGRTMSIPAHRLAAAAAATDAKRKTANVKTADIEKRKTQKLGSAAAASTQKMAVVSPPLPNAAQPGALYEILKNAQDPGVLFQEDDPDRPASDERPQQPPDPELLEAVEEAIRLLFGVKGIHHIGPGTNDAGEPVIVIAAEQGFTDKSLRQIPERVRRFKTLVAMPFDLLPLRRAR